MQRNVEGKLNQVIFSFIVQLESIACNYNLKYCIYSGLNLIYEKKSESIKEWRYEKKAIKNYSSIFMHATTTYCR